MKVHNEGPKDVVGDRMTLFSKVSIPILIVAIAACLYASLGVPAA